MKILRNSIWMLALILAATFTFVSCDKDDDIGYDLSGSWYGDLGMIWGGEDANYSELYFKSVDGAFDWKEGTGYQKDYYGQRVISHDFVYEVKDRVIYLTFVGESDMNCTIEDFKITSKTFTGEMVGKYDRMNFSLSRTKPSTRGVAEEVPTDGIEIRSVNIPR